MFLDAAPRPELREPDHTSKRGKIAMSLAHEPVWVRMEPPTSISHCLSGARLTSHEASARHDLA